MSLPCGCCTTLAEERRTHSGNRPWLSAIEYRLGTFGSFREEILDQLAATPELTRLRSRVSDDYSVASVELWAAVADVLTFYTERIANEAFVRTATLRDSVLRLVRVIDYQLAPGAAATTALAFTLERSASALIPARTRVQSVPAQGETPQKYETIEPVAALGALNQLRIFPAPHHFDPLGGGPPWPTADPDPAAVENVASLAPGDRVMVGTTATSPLFEILTVDAVTMTDDQVSVSWRDQNIGFDITGDPARRLGRTVHLFGADAPAQVVVSRQTNPADPKTAYLVAAKTDFGLGAFPSGVALDGRYPIKNLSWLLIVIGTQATGFTVSRQQVTGVNDAMAELTAIDPADPTNPVPAINATVTKLTLDDPSVLANADLREVTIHELLGEPLHFWPHWYLPRIEGDTVYVPGRRAGWSSLEMGRTIEKGKYRPGTVLDVAQLGVGRRVFCLDGRRATPIAASIKTATIVGSDVRVWPTATDDSTVVALRLDPASTTTTTVIASRPLQEPVFFASPVPTMMVSIGPGPARSVAMDPVLLGTRMIDEVAAALQAAIRGAAPGAATFSAATVTGVSGGHGSVLYVAPGVPGDEIRCAPADDDLATIAWLGLGPDQARFVDALLSGPLDPALVGAPLTGFISVTYGIDDATELAVTLPSSTTDLEDVAAALAGSPFQDAVVRLRDDGRLLIHSLAPDVEIRSFFRLELDVETPLSLDRDTAVLLGNVANASHGETVRDEIVGDGDASQAFQRFDLRKKPVTYVPAPVEGGAASSLMFFVNGAQWTEVPTLYGKEATEEVFTTSLADDGTRTIQLGDGVTGARAKTGRANLVATYRQGIGLAGRVRAGTLTNLLDRPTGLKGSTNPMAADGGADPESLETARTTAPGTVRTFGRAVSLRDFEDATLVAGEVAKATAAWVWNGRRRIVHVTVAGQQGSVFSPAKLVSLEATLGAVRDPNHRILIGNYAQVPVLVGATIIVDDRYVADTVLADARAALAAALSFERRAFVEAVDLSDVYAVLQGVTGVKAVDIDRLDLKNTDPGFRTAHGLDPADGELNPRLLMLPARPAGSGATILPAEIASVDVPALDLVLRSTGGISL